MSTFDTTLPNKRKRVDGSTEQQSTVISHEGGLAPETNGNWNPHSDAIDGLEFTDLLASNTKFETLTTANHLLAMSENLERMAREGELCDLEVGVIKRQDDGMSEILPVTMHSVIVVPLSARLKQLLEQAKQKDVGTPNGDSKAAMVAEKLGKPVDTKTKGSKNGAERRRSKSAASDAAEPKVSPRRLRIDLDTQLIEYDALVTLRTYMYLGLITLSMETVFKVLDGSQYLMLEGAIGLCVEYLTSNIDVNNVLHILLTSSRYLIEPLRQLALEFVDSNFEAVSETSYWMELDADSVKSIVSRDSLYVREEASVFQALASWSNHTVNNENNSVRLGILENMATKPDLLRLANMSREELIHVSQTSIVAKSPILRRALYDEAMSRVKKPGAHPPRLRLRNYLANHLSCAGSGTRYPIYNLQTCEHTLSGHARAVCTLTVSGNYVFSGSGDSTIRVWNAETWECIQVLEGHSNSVVALKVLNDKLLSASPDKSICVWDMATWKLERRLTGHRSAVCALAVCANEKLASGSDDGQLKIWSCRNWTLERTLPAHSHVIWSLASCREFIISGSSDTTISVWDVNTWRRVATLNEHKDEVQALSVSDNTRHLFSGSDDGVIKVWDTNTWQCINTLQGHNRAVLSLAVYGPSHLVSGLGNGVVKIWNVDPLSSYGELAEHTSCVMAVAVYKGKVISASYDKTVKIWGP